MISDEEILKKYKNRQINSIDILIERYKGPLYKMCFRLTNDRYESDDLFQDTWIKVIKKIETFDHNKVFKTWLYTICVNTYKDKYRKKKRWLNVIKDFFSNETKDNKMRKVGEEYLVDEEILDREIKNVLKKKIKNLDDDFKIPLILFYFKDISYKEIATILDIPIGTVKSRLNIAKKKIKKSMEEEHYG
ncbi:RNA polymerase sigma factor [Dethiothermospora halolimnae]|uniref:RNA polymerase sigma factor n=1 Tax=Dethiothermospora halolimnae TaxID=3114390 RepID=UPI003CCB93B7